MGDPTKRLSVVSQKIPIVDSAQQAVQAAGMGADAGRDLVGGYRLTADEVREPELGGYVDGLRDLVPVGQAHEGGRGSLGGLGHRVYLHG
jgi:hypothetical protein